MDYMKEAEAFERRIHDIKEMEKAVDTVCAYCFTNKKADCKSCVVNQIFIELMKAL